MNRLGKFGTKGFTLIELLVVIAIIGILASVIIANLNSARSKGMDAAVKSNLRNLLDQAEIYNGNHGDSYAPTTNVSPAAPCSTAYTSAQNMFGDTIILSALESAISAVGGTMGSGTYSRCFTNGSNFIISVKLKSGGFWCVDSNGNGKVITNATWSYNASLCLAIS